MITNYLVRHVDTMKYYTILSKKDLRVYIGSSTQIHSSVGNIIVIQVINSATL
jgi:hypothetical protein